MSTTQYSEITDKYNQTSKLREIAESSLKMSGGKNTYRASLDQSLGQSLNSHRPDLIKQ